MKTASILLALVVVLGFCRDAGAAGQPGLYTDVPNDTESTFKPYIEVPTPPLHDYSLTIDSHLFGFRDWAYRGSGSSYAYFGPFGAYSVPFTAIQGLVGFCLILAMLIIVPAVLTVRWRKRATQ